MILEKPCSNAPAQLSRHGDHLFGFLIGDHPRAFIAADVPFLAEMVQLGHQLGIGFDR